MPDELAEAHCMGLHDVEPHAECQMCKEEEAALTIFENDNRDEWEGQADGFRD